MNQLQKKFRACLFFTAILMLFTGMTTVKAQENIIGDWLFTMEMPDMGGMGGPGGGGMNITINSTFTKGNDGIITGTWAMEFQMPEGGMDGPGGGMGGPGGGMGGFQMPAFKIVDVKIDGQNLSFTRTAEDGGDPIGGMMTEDRQFTGTIKGDSIVLTSSSQRGEMTYKGTRKASAASAATTSSATGLEGDWEFVTTFGEMGMEFRANASFKKAADGKFTCKWESLPREGGMGGPGGGMAEITVTISDIKLDGEKVTFVQNLDMGEMGAMTSNFNGTLKGDKIEGAFTMQMGDMPSVAIRKKATATSDASGDALTGNWELTMSMADNGMGMGMSFQFDIKSTITKDAAGKYAMTWEQTMSGGDMGGMGGGMPQPTIKIEDIKLDGEKLTFVQKLNFGDMGGMGMGGGEMASNFTGTVKDNVMEGKMVGQDMGDMGGMGGMPPMEFTIKGTKK